MRLICMECGKQWERKNPLRGPEPRCPKCKSVDIDVASPEAIARNIMRRAAAISLLLEDDNEKG